MTGRSLALAAVVTFALACTKSESPESASPASSATSAASVASSAAPTAPATTTASSPAPSTDTPTAAAKDATDAGRAMTDARKTDAGPASGTPAAASASAGPAECGTKPLPDCPLQAWMKANTNPPMMAKDLPGLASALDKIVTFAPPGYTNWASIAQDGARAARTGDLTAAKASCRSCHDQYKKQYKAELRDRKI